VAGEAEPAVAYPPRRIVELAKAFGQFGIVQSICQDDFGPAMTAIINVIIDQIVRSCLPRPLVRQQDGTVACNVVWELPAAAAASTGTPTQCSERPYLGPVDEGRATINDRGGNNCKVTQLPVMVPVAGVAGAARTEPLGDGWYYDDFSQERKRLCAQTEQQRVAFTQAARPPNGVIVKLECLNETQRVEDTRTDVALSVEQPGIGSACGGAIEAEGVQARASGDSACLVTLSDGTVDASLFCHPALNVCMRTCVSSRDCPAAWVCDDRPQSVASAGGRAYCVNPVCGQ
jgi:hypothetical protein